MRIAILSDIHGNCIALDSVMANLQQHPIDQIVCLGDAIQGGPQPAQVVARLRELNCPVVLGNADDEVLTGRVSEKEKITPARRQKLDQIRDWQLTQLSDQDIAFMKTFKPVHEMPLGDGRTLMCFHGSPGSYNDIILPMTPDEDVRRLLAPRNEVIYTGGHTHVQFTRHFGQTFYFNPGSVGYAYRHDQSEERFNLDPWAEYAVLSVTGGQTELSFRRIPFDVKTLIEVYRESGRPYGVEVIAAYGR